MRIITVTNQKGGVGKTTTAVNLAFGLAMEGRRTLLVDSDPQANATTAIMGTEELESTLYDLFVSDVDPNAIIIGTRQKNLYLLPSEIRLAGVESELLRKDKGQTILNRKFREANLKRFDYIIIDTPPSLGLLTVNALAASTEVIISVSASFFAIKGLDQLERVLELVRDRLESADLKVRGVVCTFYDYTNVADDVVSIIQKRYSDRAFVEVIPKNVKVEEAHSRCMSVFEYAPLSKGSQAYAKLVEEVDRG